MSQSKLARKSFLVAMAAGLGLSGSAALLAADGPVPAPAPSPTPAGSPSPADKRVSPTDQVQFEQKTVEAQMKELQERMYHLADLTRVDEPDDSARLLMAVRKAREDLILEQMRDCVEQLGQADLSKASDEQQQIIVKLLELKKLLTTTDLDMQMQLDKLRKMAAALKAIDAGIKEERREQKQSGEAAKAGQADPKALAAGQGEQKKNRQATESVAQGLRDLGGETAKAAETLGTASTGMKVAEGHLGGGRPGDAQGSQSRAADDMQKARDQIAAEQQKIMEELQASVRKQVVAALTDMLDRQETICSLTEGVVNRPGGGDRQSGDRQSGDRQSGDRQTGVRVKQLAPAETAVVRIADDTLELIETTQFSVALPPALSDIRRSCQDVADKLDAGTADRPLVVEQQLVIRDLKDLLETFKQLSAQPGNGQCKCKGNKNKLLAELKVLRVMQVRLDEQTTRTDAIRAAGGDATHETAIARDQQEKVRSAVDKIHEDLTSKN